MTDLPIPTQTPCLSKELVDEHDSQPPPCGTPQPPINICGHARVQIGDIYNYNVPESAEGKGEMSALLKRLRFPEMFNRYSTIELEHEGTCEWILSEKRDETSDAPEWDSLTEWLKDDHQVYWISGKPGSGKSTLTKYLATNLADPENLHKSLIVSFWFWEAGTQLEKNLEGCLRSLLWQSLQSPLRQTTAAKPTIILHPTLPWKRASLIKALKDKFLGMSNEGIAIRVFLDGVDESGSDAESILETVQQLAGEIPGLKFCISSRPEQLFVDALSDYPKLRLQDLNRRDINKVINDDFFSKPSVARLLKNKSDEKEHLRHLLDSRAQGVFLWVRLAIRNLLRGITNRDNIEILTKRLESLPDDLDRLYSVMLSRGDNNLKYYGEITALYFTLILHRPMSIVDFCLAINQQHRKDLLKPAGWSIENVERAICWEDVIVWLTTRSGGLLEAHHIEHYIPTTLFSGRLEFLTVQSFTLVDFIHRTARSYLLNTMAGSIILSSCTINASDVTHICFEIMLVTQYVLPWLNGDLVILKPLDWRSPYCVTCVTPPREIFECTKTIWNELNRQNGLDTDHGWCSWGVWQLEELFFASHANGTIDYARTCCRLGWYTHAQKDLEDPGQVIDAYSATRLFYEAVCVAPWLSETISLSDDSRDLYWMKKQEQMFELLHCLKALGANLSNLLILPCGEQVTFLPRLLANISRYRDTRPDFHYLIKSIAGNSEHRIVSTITDVALLDRNMWEGTSLCLWGQYGITDICNMLHRRDFSYLKTSESSRIFVIYKIYVRPGRGVPYSEGHQSAIYGITKDDSDEILTYLESRKIHEGPDFSLRIFEGTVRILLYGLDDNVEYIQTICGRSRRLQSIQEALLFIGKSQENIDRFISMEEARFRRLGRLDETSLVKTRLLTDRRPNEVLSGTSLEDNSQKLLSVDKLSLNDTAYDEGELEQS